MKAVLLAGGLGTRLSEETHHRPKPMIEIGGKPILWHIMKIYSHHGINDFIICCGYKGHLIKEYFKNYYLYQSDVTFDMNNNSIKVHQNKSESWKVTLVNTGENTSTGGRIKRIYDFVKDEKAFCLTYGDGVSDVNITSLIKFHEEHNKKATLLAVRPPGRYGALKFKNIDDNTVDTFIEKPDGDGTWINGGFFVLHPDVINHIKDDQTIWEKEPLSSLAKENDLVAYKYKGFWQSMDTLRDKIKLEELWINDKAPWKIWK